MAEPTLEELRALGRQVVGALERESVMSSEDVHRIAAQRSTEIYRIAAQRSTEIKRGLPPGALDGQVCEHGETGNCADCALAALRLRAEKAEAERDAALAEVLSLESALSTLFVVAKMHGVTGARHHELCDCNCALCQARLVLAERQRGER